MSKKLFSTLSAFTIGAVAGIGLALTPVAKADDTHKGDAAGTHADGKSCAKKAEGDAKCGEGKCSDKEKKEGDKKCNKGEGHEDHGDKGCAEKKAH